MPDDINRKRGDKELAVEKSKRGKDERGKLTLDPVPYEEAVADLLKVKPEEKKAKGKRAKGKGQERTT